MELREDEGEGDGKARFNDCADMLSERRLILLISPDPHDLSRRTGGAAIPLVLGEPLKSWVLDPDLEKYRGMDPRAIVDVAIDTIAGGVPTTSAPTTARATRATGSSSRCATCAAIRNSYRSSPGFLPRIATPVTMINGQDDRVVPVANAEFLDQRLPNSRVEIINAGHFLWEEAPQQYASIVIKAISADQPS